MKQNYPNIQVTEIHRSGGGRGPVCVMVEILGLSYHVRFEEVFEIWVLQDSDSPETTAMFCHNNSNPDGTYKPEAEQLIKLFGGHRHILDKHINSAVEKAYQKFLAKGD